ncbi:hypothetical protein CFE70_005016 [Pyrenophora teres f. teres 0-1]|uniref:Pectate lyase superfamily protein domain-containing protein n=1 Tax=Pyrenophora teres f. teres (strain 0-1) TaxID=861557 RepID=E3RP83_PYRTT|nr:hypothetical protein PTT_10430 [Pyrenophora teres f. teres 0-1]
MHSKLLLFCVTFCAYTAHAVDLYVSPSGSDSNAGTAAAPFKTLTKAQQAVRNQIAGTANEGITVHVGAGTYTLSAPLKFTSEDSGKNGVTVKWVGTGATISGGLKITNWVAGSNGVYSADVPMGLKSRNLYVNGKASNYARKKIANRKDFTYTSTDRYAPIKSVGNKQLIMKQNTWYNQIWGYDTVDKNNADFGVWVQNALALLTEGGQFYLDSAAGKIYYKPLSGENMASVYTYLGLSETLIVIGGTYADPVHDISFQDLNFAHTTWLQPANIGYIDQQTGGNICEDKTYDSSNFESTRPNWCQMPSAIQISAAKNIVFSGGNYAMMGAGGIGIGNDANAHITGTGLGANNIAIKDGYFTQVMGNSITAGGIRADAHHPSDARMTNSQIEISGNIFYNVSSLFSSTVPILATYERLRNALVFSLRSVLVAKYQTPQTKVSRRTGYC